MHFNVMLSKNKTFCAMKYMHTWTKKIGDKIGF